MKMDFQNIFLAVLGVFVIVAVAVFSQTSSSSSDAAKAPKIVIWGDVDPAEGLRDAFVNFNQLHRKEFDITYVYKNPKTFDFDLIESIADNKAPDLVLLSNSKIIRLESKILQIPYTQLPLASFQEQYVDSARVFTSPSGVLGVPLVLDPLVLYWNRDLFTNASILSAPKFWDEVLSLQQPLTKRSTVDGSFAQSAIALGEFTNISHAKDIVSAMLMQAGIPLVYRDGKGSIKVSLNSEVATTGEQPIDSTLRFFIDFANPNKTLYSWNRTLPNSIDVFLSDKLAMYIGKASDYKILKNQNPHLNFSVAALPQMRTMKTETTGAEVYALSVVKNGKQVPSAISALIAIVSSSDFIPNWSRYSMLPPARRDLLAKPQSDLVLPYFYDAALRSRAWLDPDDKSSDESFRLMIEGLSSGRFQVPAKGVSFLNQELTDLVARIMK